MIFKGVVAVEGRVRSVIFRSLIGDMLETLGLEGLSVLIFLFANFACDEPVMGTGGRARLSLVVTYGAVASRSVRHYVAVWLEFDALVLAEVNAQTAALTLEHWVIEQPMTLRDQRTLRQNGDCQ